MDKSIKGTLTEQNLLKAFLNESQARNRYTYFAKAAQKEGYEQIASIFEETALHELSHAKNFLKFLENNDIEITTTISNQPIGNTVENLRYAVGGEHEEFENLYPKFAAIATEEGFLVIAAAFKTIANAEQAHAKRYGKLLENLENNSVFEKSEEVDWQCRKCGYVHKGKKALKNCPACHHPQSYFQVIAENY